MLLGQSLIQRDVCGEGWPGMKALAALLRRADVVFTDLETPIDGPGAGDPTRVDATLHHAPPEVL
ncbi:MAG: capsule biosynthesis protein CapA, partial [Proteobacteria bacterium]|nr:capsule biosynthesis protein CapA [Pseudomonadota bacterium]